MIRKMIIFVLLLSLGGCINRSSEQSPRELTDQQQQDKIKRCATLQQRIKDLKGSPVRQTTAREYYAKECLDQPADNLYN